jgi:hypothetical protein
MFAFALLALALGQEEPLPPDVYVPPPPKPPAFLAHRKETHPGTKDCGLQCEDSRDMCTDACMSRGVAKSACSKPCDTVYKKCKKSCEDAGKQHEAAKERDSKKKKAADSAEKD